MPLNPTLFVKVAPDAEPDADGFYIAWLDERVPDCGDPVPQLPGHHVVAVRRSETEFVDRSGESMAETARRLSREGC